jgi:hypothetical protein
MRGLSTVDIVTQPHDCMSVCVKDFKAPATKKEGKMARRMAIEFYQLVTLGNSLRHYEAAVVDALGLLDSFFTEHGGDADRYAIENRMRCIDEYGSDNESDWEPDGEGPDGPRWKVAYKGAAEAAEHYGIFADLGQYFPGNGNRSECIGSSEIVDFQLFTMHVRRQTDFSFNKLFSGFLGQPLTTYRLGEDGEMTPMSLADEVESDINKDIQNASISEAFDTVIFAGGVAYELFKSPIEAPKKLEMLRGLLRHLVTADLPSLPQPYATPNPIF